jgi:hypothetical protein
MKKQRHSVDPCLTDNVAVTDSGPTLSRLQRSPDFASFQQGDAKPHITNDFESPTFTRFH